jgi:uncharacterized protein YecE (DUF72 family)
MMQFFVGTSGYGYKEWRGSFYPEKMPPTQMLNYYAQHFSAVELNNTFRKMPEASELKARAKETPSDFRFTLKAPQVITHFRRLKEVTTEAKTFLRAASALKRRLGPLLFQFPPNFKKDLPRLEAFLKQLGKRTRAAFEFRHPSWFDDDVYAALRTHAAALCVAEVDEEPTPTIVSTAPFGYLRLRRTDYRDQRLRTWIKKICSQPWNEVFVFFRHEETRSGPRFARRFLELAGRNAP